MKNLILLALTILTLNAQAQEDSILYKSRDLVIYQEVNETKSIVYRNMEYKHITVYESMSMTNADFETFKQQVLTTLKTNEPTKETNYTIFRFTKHIAMVMISANDFFYVSDKLIEKL